MSIKDKIIQMLDKADERTLNLMYVYIKHLLGLEEAIYKRVLLLAPFLI